MVFNEINQNNYFLIKTYNGKFYQPYREKQRVGLYNIKPSDNLARKQTQYNIFKQDVKIGDIILIPSYKKKYITIGSITSTDFIDDEMIYREVNWIKEIAFVEFDHKFHKYFYRDSTIICLSEIGELIDRLLYSIFIKEEKYHIVLKVNQKNNILCQSLYGLYQIIFDEVKIDDIEIKLSLQSPGIIEFISENLDFILIIIKLIKIIKLLKQDEDLLESEQKDFLNENEPLIKKFYLFGVNKLQLNLTNSDINQEDVLK